MESDTGERMELDNDQNIEGERDEELGKENREKGIGKESRKEGKRYENLSE